MISPQRLRQTRFEHRSFSCGDGHRLHIGLAGQEDGVPLLLLHGGPGSGCGPQMLVPVDLNYFRVIMIDQRGSGRSSPAGRVHRNMTSWLIRNIESVRRYLQIERWYVLGGSWGATLAITYAGMHPAAVKGVVLRATFLASAREVRRLFGASRHTAPQAWLNLYRASGADRPAALLDAAYRKLKQDHSSGEVLTLAYDGLERAVLGRADRTLNSSRPKENHRKPGMAAATHARHESRVG